MKRAQSDHVAIIGGGLGGLAAACTLAARGYQVSWDRTDHGCALIIHDCPYRQVARAQPLVCEMDHTLVGALLQRPFRSAQCIATGSAECRFEIDE